MKDEKERFHALCQWKKETIRKFLISSAALVMLLAALVGCGLSSQKADNSGTSMATTEQHQYTQPVNATEPIVTETDAQNEPCLEFHGDLIVEGNKQTVDLFYYQSGDYQFHCELVIGGETIVIPLREDFMASTVHQGFEIQDVNQDGFDDILIEHGIFGQIRISSCYVYTSEGYEAVSGFEDLSNPEWLDSDGIITEQWSTMPNNGVNRYRVQGTQLILEESMLCQHIAEPQGGPWYTIKRRIKGELVVVQESVSESEIDLNYWYR